MLLHSIELRDFRNYESLELSLAPGVTVVVGSNGQGKTNLLEAIGYLATLSSFRGAPDAALVRDGADAAIIRAQGTRSERRLLIEAELRRVGRNRTLVNRQPLRRANDLLGALRVTVFAPDDLDLVKGSPSQRRRYLDELATALDPNVAARRSDVDRILKQRNVLLKQAKGRLNTEIAATLDVWDAKLAEAGDALGRIRTSLAAELGPALAEAYADLAGPSRRATLRYEPFWFASGLTQALTVAREDDVRRGVSTVGPHRDEIDLFLGGDPAKTHGSQGEQRSLALALRLAGHRLGTEAMGSPPILLLDDVFSELDAARRSGLLANLPKGQTLITSAADVPAETEPDLVMRVTGGTIHQ